MHPWQGVLNFLPIPIYFQLGFLLLLFPWLPIWSRNYFVQEYSWVDTVAMNYFVRGAVSGLGWLNLSLAFWEIWHFKKD